MSRKFLILNFIIILFLLAGCDILSYHETCKIYQDCIYLIDSNGSDLYKVVDLGHTDDSIMGGGGSLLPGADNIQFTSDDEKLVYGNDCKFYLVNLDGSDNTLLSGTLRVWGKPSISTDNQTIVFSAYTNEVLDIYMTTLNGAEPINLTNSYEADEKYPNFSPDGNEIIFSKDIDTCSFICKKDLNTGEYDILAVSNDLRFTYPVFSPDGIKIFYIKHRELFVMNSDGSEQVKIFDGIESSLSFSADGSKIVFNNYSNLYVIIYEGFIINEIEIDSYPRNPSLSSDGMFIVYSGVSISGGVYVIGSDGSNRRKIHHGCVPAFSSDSSKIAFSYYFLYKTIHSS